MEGKKVGTSRARELTLFDFRSGPMIQVEVNLEEAPLFLLKSREREQDSIESRSTVITQGGDRQEQYWKITGSRQFGLPGPLDQDVFVAVMKLVSRRGGMPPDGRISFSLYELLEILGKTHSGTNYEDLRNSLDRLAAADIYAENAFYSREDEEFKSHRFRLWGVDFHRTKKRKGRASEHHTLRFDDIVVRSYLQNYLKSLDSAYYYSLGKPISRSLYRLIDVKREDRLSWTVDLDRLRQLVSMPASYSYPSKIKRHLEPAHRELVERGFLTEATHEQRGKSNVVHYKISDRFVRERTQSAPSLTDEECLAVDSLVANGVWPAAAGRLVKAQGPDRCLRYVEALAYQENVKKPGAWLTRFIENGWPVRVLDAPLRPDVAPRSDAAPRDRETGRKELPAEGQDLAYDRDASGSGPPTPRAEGEQEEPLDWTKAVAQRFTNGDFDEAIDAFETIPYEEYSKLVGTKAPVRDAAGNRYHVSLDGDLYVYLGGDDAEHRYYVKTLDRSQGSPGDAGR